MRPHPCLTKRDYMKNMTFRQILHRIGSVIRHTFISCSHLSVAGSARTMAVLAIPLVKHLPFCQYRIGLRNRVLQDTLSNFDTVGRDVVNHQVTAYRIAFAKLRFIIPPGYSSFYWQEQV